MASSGVAGCSLHAAGTAGQAALPVGADPGFRSHVAHTQPSKTEPLDAPLLPGELKDSSVAGVPPSPSRRRRGCCCCCCSSVGPDVLLSVLVASAVAMLLGYDIGVMSGAKRFVQRDLDLTDRQIENIVGSLNLVSAAGGVISGSLADSCLGRRGTVAFACITSVAGSIVMALAPGNQRQGYPVLMVGRFLCGVAVGAGIMIAPLYISELSPKSLRGSLVSFFEVRRH